MKLDQPVIILFYGGPIHGSKRVVGDSTVIANSMPKQRVVWAKDSADPYAIANFRRTQYSMRQVARADHSARLGLVNSRYSYVMIPDGKTYNWNKVWRMMERYNCMPMLKTETTSI
jgi:hypothetical protein